MTQSPEAPRLEACPFCGKSQQRYRSVTTKGFAVFCENCLARAGHAPTKPPAVANWNRRPPPPDRLDLLRRHEKERVAYHMSGTDPQARYMAGLLKRQYVELSNALAAAPGAGGQKGAVITCPVADPHGRCATADECAIEGRCLAKDAAPSPARGGENSYWRDKERLFTQARELTALRADKQIVDWQQKHFEDGDFREAVREAMAAEEEERDA